MILRVPCLGVSLITEGACRLRTVLLKGVEVIGSLLDAMCVDSSGARIEDRL